MENNSGLHMVDKEYVKAVMEGQIKLFELGAISHAELDQSIKYCLQLMRTFADLESKLEEPKPYRRMIRI